MSVLAVLENTCNSLDVCPLKTQIPDGEIHCPGGATTGTLCYTMCRPGICSISIFFSKIGTLTLTVVSRAGHSRYFLIFSIIKMIFFCIFYQVNLTGSGFLNRTDVEIGYFLLLKKIKNTESAQLW